MGEPEKSILNDSSVTRHNPQSGNGSSPDLTICSTVWSDRCPWSVDEEEIGGSDHLPITGKKPRWYSNGVVWKDFNEAVEITLTSSRVPASLKERVERLVDAIIMSAVKHVRRVKPCKRTKCWMTPKVRRLSKNRNALRKTIKTTREEWLQACKEVSIARQEARREQGGGSHVLSHQ